MQTLTYLPFRKKLSMYISFLIILLSYVTLTELMTQDIVLLFLKFDSSLLEDDDYVKVVTYEYSDWLEEGKDFQDPRII